MQNKLQGLACVVAAFILFAASGCTKEKNSSTATALLGLHLHTYIGDSLVDPSALNVYIPDSLGRVEKLSHAQFYITNVSLHSTTKGWYTVPNSLILKREENEEYTIGTVPADNYDDVRFTVGLGPAYNNTTPASHNNSSGQDTVLSSTLEAAMYYGAGQGYKFLSVAGFVDTSAANNGNNQIAFSYDIGGNGDTVNITLPQEAFTLLPSTSVGGTVQYVHVICDYGHLIQNVDIVHNVNARIGNTYGTGQQPGIATQVWNNILSMFRYECSTPNGDC